MKKGIVISAPFEVVPEGGIRVNSNLDTKDLRKYLLYWDELVLAQSNIIATSSDDFDYLISAGVGRNESIPFSGKIDLSTVMIAAQQFAWEVNEKREPGCWSYAQSSSIPYFVRGAKTSVIEFELYDAIPVPGDDVPLEDILRFKERRRDELIEFRIHLDELYQSVLQAGNVPSAKSAAIAKLNMSISAIEKTMSEGNIRKLVGSLKNTFQSDFSGVVGAGLAVGAIPQFTPMSPIVAGIVAGGLYLGVKTAISPSFNDGQRPMNYIRSIRREIL